jgi:TorA maturation chaperone TorD
MTVQLEKTMHGADIGHTGDPGSHGLRRAARSEADARAMSSSIDDVDQARAREYSLLSTLLARSPDARLIERLAQLRGDAATPLGRAHAALGKAAASATAEGVEREYFALFVGLRDGGLFPYASYYLTGFLQGRPLARLRDALCRLGIVRAPEHSEPEDHVALLLAIMASLVGGWIAAPAGADREIFEQSLAPWIGSFFADLERAQSAELYASVGSLGRAFMEIEAEAFALPE